MITTRLHRLVLSGLLFAASFATSAANYSFVQDFSATKVVNGASQDRWQYFQGVVMTNRTGVYPHLPIYAANLGGFGYPAWRPIGAGVKYPHVGKNDSDHIIFGVEPGEGVMIPSPDGTGVAIGFLAPAAGLYQVQGSVRAADNRNGTGVNWYLDRGTGRDNLASGTLGMGENNNFSFPAVYLEAGQFLYLVIDGNGNIGSDFIAVDLRVSDAVVATEIVWQPTLRFSGMRGRSYRVDYIEQVGGSEEWKPLTTFTEDGLGRYIVDPAWTTTNRRFYRTVELP